MDSSHARFDEQAVLRSLFAAYPDALLLVDAGGEIVLANPAAAELLRCGTEELVGMSVDEFVPDAVRPSHAAFRSVYAAAPRTRPMGSRMELVAKRRDGSQIMVEIALSPLHEQGLPYVVAAIRGIEAYPRVTQALRRARYSDLLAQFGRLAVDSRDPQRLVDEAPRVAADALQVPHTRVYLLEADHLHFVVASGVGSLEHEGPGTRVLNHAHCIAGHVVVSGGDLVVSDPEHPLAFPIEAPLTHAGLPSALAVPLFDRGKAVGVLAARAGPDVRFGDEEIRFLQSLASLLATSLQRARSDEALNHAQRLESIGQLTGGIAHDFNNLLTVIAGNLQVVQDAPPIADDPALQQMIGAAARASHRASELTEKLLAFSRRQMLRPSPVDVDRLVHSLADMLRRTLDQHIRIEVHTDKTTTFCLADRTQLESALLNIAINARDAMPDGGTLRFTTQAVDELPDPPSAPERPPDSGTRYVAIAVSDTGKGMSDTVMEHAFEPFFTTKDVGRGTGLGLSTVYGFATQSRGSVKLHSTLGQGTTVTIYLPQAAAQVPKGSRPATVAVVPPGLRVLIVEDEADVRAVTRKLTAALGCQVAACSSAEEALIVLAPNGGAQFFDLLIADVALGPGMRGTELAREVQRRCPALPVVLMSGFSSDVLDDPPTSTWLSKPFSQDGLACAIAQALRVTRSSTEAAG